MQADCLPKPSCHRRLVTFWLVLHVGMQDNDSRMAALQSLTNLPLSQLVHELPENLPKDPAPEHELRQLVGLSRCFQYMPCA